MRISRKTTTRTQTLRMTASLGSTPTCIKLMSDWPFPLTVPGHRFTLVRRRSRTSCTMTQLFWECRGYGLHYCPWLRDADQQCSLQELRRNSMTRWHIGYRNGELGLIYPNNGPRLHALSTTPLSACFPSFTTADRSGVGILSSPPHTHLLRHPHVLSLGLSRQIPLLHKPMEQTPPPKYGPPKTKPISPLMQWPPGDLTSGGGERVPICSTAQHLIGTLGTLFLSVSTANIQLLQRSNSPPT